MIKLTTEERNIADAIQRLKEESGSHSPSIYTLTENIPHLRIRIDACFLSNPYARDLLLKYLKEELIDTNKISEVVEYYPSQNHAIASSLSEFLNVSSKNIFVGNGATEIIQAVIHNFTKRKIVINLPTFSPYYEFVEDGVEVIYHQLNKDEDFKLNVEEYLRLIKEEGPDTIILINPNNPTGIYMYLEELRDLLEQVSFVENIIVDESFIHFSSQSEEYKSESAAALWNHLSNLIIVKSMSKDFGVAGLRAGYAIFDETKIARLLKTGYLWNISGLVEYFFKLSVRDDFLKAYEETRHRYVYESQLFFSELARIEGFRVYPSQANFVLVELMEGSNSFDFAAKMLIKYGVYLRDCSDKKGLDGEFVRIASRTVGENREVILLLKEVIAEGSIISV